jgi:hypothetical protein
VVVESEDDEDDMEKVDWELEEIFYGNRVYLVDRTSSKV